MAPSDTDSVSSWVTCGKKTPRSEVVFLCQVLILYTVIVVSIHNLAEIQYPHSWYSVKNNEAWLKVHFYKESELQKHLVLLPDGYYSSAKRIPHRGEKHMKELKNKFDMGFNEINNKIDMKVKKDYQVIISPFLQSMLGFRQAIFRGGGGGGGGWGGGVGGGGGVGMFQIV